MAPAITRMMRGRWFAICVHASFWLLLYAALTNLGGKAVGFGETETSANPPRSPVPTAPLERLFAPEVWPKTVVATNMVDPFFTRYFTPPQAAPPTTRKIEVTYQGFYQAADGPKHAIFKLGDAFVDTAVGGKVATSLFVAEATMQALTLTNPAAQTNFVPLNVKKEFVVPIQ
jgi:hypothetical protein